MNEKLFPQRLKELRAEKGITLEELAKKIGTTKTTLSRYENGERSPKLQLVGLLANYFQVDMSWLSGQSEQRNSFNILPTYTQLSPARQKKVYDFAKHELEDQNRSNVIQGNFGRAVDEDEKQEVSYVGLLSAGHGYPNYDKERPLGTVTMRKSQIPSYYDLAFMVDGNSMCPTFENGEIVFIKQTTEVLNGQFGAIEINGEAFLKKMYVENQRLRLVSLNCEYNENGNRLYPDFYADEYDDLYVIGRVIV
ncbi:XRE family transcriptional regulator [Enterococcus faecium]|uniref:XRE family transcriptional regulator n=1 Tax=Enterococcus faecium TaxID=1352 RepID=UPI0019144180|nr:helix-turn-helix domain-containing protein [Enterococcus faecium]MBK5028077.1 helix-turn-helix domain-containing protein [Enterococcus faecium]MBK5038821.1 helix-turn-helix domain-containing protein [Enterococcus faecium]MBK5043894.1 helix-turn-helix domain-containing protein [Enterococcus faecium]MBK5068816.1 helix-turn-helix domain-containing protein [Enterococcus faecium]MBK5132114.1 helix-turn-helix domain-containing protein [Enterococcus faecium]